jgi:hypothetical protein
MRTPASARAPLMNPDGSDEGVDRGERFSQREERGY